MTKHFYLSDNKTGQALAGRERRELKTEAESVPHMSRVDHIIQDGELACFVSFARGGVAWLVSDCCQLLLPPPPPSQRQGLPLLRQPLQLRSSPMPSSRRNLQLCRRCRRRRKPSLQPPSPPPPLRRPRMRSLSLIQFLRLRYSQNFSSVSLWSSSTC